MSKEPGTKKFRHKYEWILLILGYTLTILIVTLCLLLFYQGIELASWTYIILAGLFVPLFGRVFIRFMYYQKIKNAIEINENQLPELYDLYKEVAFTMGFTADKGQNKIPPLYVVNGFGIKSFFASKPVFQEKYIVLKDDVANIIYEDTQNIGGLRFMIAHHLAYIKCHEAGVNRLTISPIMTLLFLDKLLSRTEQYTADRVAAYYFPGDIESAIRVYLIANFGKNVNSDGYFDCIGQFDNKLSLKLINLTSDKWPYRRLKALKEAQTKGWNVHGKIF